MGSDSYNFVLPAADVVKALYRHLLGREPDPDGLAGWSNLIIERNDPTFALKGILESEEYALRHPKTRVEIQQHSLAERVRPAVNSVTERKLFFLHNPKAAGTSIIRVLEAELGERTSCPFIANTIRTHAALNGDYSAFKGYDVYIGHYGRDVFEAVRAGHAYITNFRHPVSRIISLYNYFRLVVPINETMSSDYEIDFACVLAAKTHDFKTFIRLDHPYIRTYTSNYHFRQMTSSPWDVTLPLAPLESAHAFIDGMLGYYVCEYDELSTRLLRDRLGIASIPRENVVGTRPESVRLEHLDRDDFRRIMDMNDLDFAIYRYAVDRLLEAF